jgi:hypothetical protein
MKARMFVVGAPKLLIKARMFVVVFGELMEGL